MSPTPSTSRCQPPTEEEWDAWNPMLEDYISGKNSLAFNPDKEPLTAVTCGKVKPISSKVGNITICDRFAQYGCCIDGDYCNKLHVAPHIRERIWTIQNTFESNRDRVIMNYTYLSPVDIKPDPDALLLASVTNAISPGNMYLILPYDTMNLKQCTKDDLQFYIDRVQKSSSAKTKLQKYHEQLAGIFDRPYRLDNVEDDIYPSQIVACKLKDGRFRRAMVADFPEDDYFYKLFLLDVGTEIVLPRELIYDIKAHCLSEPPMALNCRLNIKPAGGSLNWSQEALEYFVTQTRSKAKFLYCTIFDFIAVDQIFTIDLYDTETRESLTDLMISKGFAEKCLI